MASHYTVYGKSAFLWSALCIVVIININNTQPLLLYEFEQMPLFRYFDYYCSDNDCIVPRNCHPATNAIVQFPSTKKHPCSLFGYKGVFLGIVYLLFERLIWSCA